MMNYKDSLKNSPVVPLRLSLLEAAGLWPTALKVFKEKLDPQGNQDLLRLDVMDVLQLSTSHETKEFQRWARKLGFFPKLYKVMGFEFPDRMCLKGSWLHHVHFTGSKLHKVHFEGARLVQVSFKDADLKGAHFERAKLEGACFTGANLHKADFNGANLQAADFTGANLNGANFRGADLRCAIFPEVLPKNVRFNGAARGWVEDEIHGEWVVVDGRMQKRLDTQG